MGPDLAPAVAAGAFWTFVAVCVVTAGVRSTLRDREVQKTIRQAIEKGHALDPETLDKLLQAGRPPKGPPPTAGLLFGGIMLLAIAAGLALIGFFSAQSNPAALYQGLGAASMVGLLGTGLLVSVAVFRARRDDGPK